MGKVREGEVRFYFVIHNWLPTSLGDEGCWEVFWFWIDGWMGW